MPEEINNKLSYAFGVPFVFFINNELTEEFHSRASIRLEIAEAEYAEAKDRLRTAIQETDPVEKFGTSKGEYKSRVDGLFMSNHRPFFWSYNRKLN